MRTTGEGRLYVGPGADRLCGLLLGTNQLDREMHVVEPEGRASCHTCSLHPNGVCAGGQEGPRVALEGVTFPRAATRRVERVVRTRLRVQLDGRAGAVAVHHAY